MRDAASDGADCRENAAAFFSSTNLITLQIIIMINIKNKNERKQLSLVYEAKVLLQSHLIWHLQ